MGRDNRLADMNKVYVRTKAERKEQLATWWKHTEEQFKATRDQFKALLIRLSNMGGHNERHHRPPLHVSEEEDEHDDGYKSGIPSAEHQM